MPTVDYTENMNEKQAGMALCVCVCVCACHFSEICVFSMGFINKQYKNCCYDAHTSGISAGVGCRVDETHNAKWIRRVIAMVVSPTFFHFVLP